MFVAIRDKFIQCGDRISIGIGSGRTKIGGLRFSVTCAGVVGTAGKAKNYGEENGEN
jgi:hypothetical protein